MTHHVKLAPVRVKEYSEDLGVDVSRIVGYRIVCSCGQHSKVRHNVRALAVWRDQHLRRAIH